MLKIPQPFWNRASIAFRGSSQKGLLDFLDTNEWHQFCNAVKFNENTSIIIMGRVLVHVGRVKHGRFFSREKRRWESLRVRPRRAPATTTTTTTNARFFHHVLRWGRGRRVGGVEISWYVRNSAPLSKKEGIVSSVVLLVVDVDAMRTSGETVCNTS